MQKKLNIIVVKFSIFINTGLWPPVSFDHEQHKCDSQMNNIRGVDNILH